MLKFRSAKLQDIEQIQGIEKEYYGNFNCPEKTLRDWISKLSDNFIVAEQNNKIIGFIFFEYLNKIKAIPFVHKLKHMSNGRYVYISEVGILDEFQHLVVLQKLFDKLTEKTKKDGCKAVIWLTGSKSKHDKLESKILLNNGFKKKENVKHWEAYPNYFVNDHYIWIKSL